MSEAAQTNDQSMDEILASIRRIISDDDNNTVESHTEPQVSKLDSMESDEFDAFAESEAKRKAVADAEESMDSQLKEDAPLDQSAIGDVLSAIEMDDMGDDPATDEMLEKSVEEAVEPVVQNTAEAGPADDILELSADDVIEAQAEASAPVAEAPAPEVKTPTSSLEDSLGDMEGEPELVTADDIDFGDDEESTEEMEMTAPAPESVSIAEPVADTAPAPETTTAVELPAPVERQETPDLVSDITSNAVAGAFKNLSQTLLAEQPRTVEDLMVEMMRPMIKEWLDQNLPDMVQKMVEAEIHRIANKG